ncbi:MAG: energy transducer TonB, partial [Polyangiaceae bacterium]
MHRPRIWRCTLAALLIAGTARAQEGVPSGATPVSEGQGTVRVTKPPKLVRFVEAEIPAGEARSADVVLAITVGADGAVRDASVLESGGARFDAAAIGAARRFGFEPAEVNGRPAAVKIRYRYSFRATPTPTPTPIPIPTPIPTPLPIPTTTSTPTADIDVRGSPRRRDVTDTTISAAQGSKVAGTQGDP